MYLYIPEHVLQSDLNASQKIVYSYLLLLLKQNRHYFGSVEYLSGKLGIGTLALKEAMENLIARDLVEIVYENGVETGVKGK